MAKRITEKDLDDVLQWWEEKKAAIPAGIRHGKVKNLTPGEWLQKKIRRKSKDIPEVPEIGP